MTTADSVAGWLVGLQAGDQTAAQKLWERYFKRLVRLAREKLPAHLRRSFDEEDVVLSAFRNFFAAMEEGRYPQLDDSESLWNLLVVITARKATSYIRRQCQVKRGGGEIRGESALLFLTAEEELGGIDQVIGKEPTPEFAVDVAEQCKQLLDALENEPLKQIALLKMEGYTVDEIAERMGSTRRTVERRLQMIRGRWRDVGLAD